MTAGGWPSRLSSEGLQGPDPGWIETLFYHLRAHTSRILQTGDGRSRVGMAAHTWGWPPTRGGGHSHVWGWRVHTWGWPLTPGDDRAHVGMAAHTWGWRKPRGDGGSPVGMAAHAMGMAMPPPRKWLAGSACGRPRKSAANRKTRSAPAPCPWLLLNRKVPVAGSGQLKQRGSSSRRKSNSGGRCTTHHERRLAFFFMHHICGYKPSASCHHHL